MNFSMELKEYLANKDYNFNVSTRHYGVLEFEDIEMLYQFILKQESFWQQHNEGSLSKIKGLYSNAISNFKELMRLDKAGNYNNALSYLNQAKNYLNDNSALIDNSSIVELLLEEYSKNPTKGEILYNYLINNSIYNNKDGFKAALKGSFFEESDIYDVTLSASSQSLNKLEKEYITKINNAEALYQNQFNDYKGTLSENFNSFISDAEETKSKLLSWKEKFEEDTNNYLMTEQAEVEKLKHLYEEKLRLESPAKYWEDLHKEYRKKGIIWMVILIIISMLSFTQLFKLLENAPNVFFEINENFKLNDLKATIVFILLTSITVYLLKILVTLTLSAFHLSRDAKERYQLTHIFLAMIKEGAITDKEREIIFQALFSRADTGLLKGDSTPAIPGNVMSQIVKNFSS